jgi:2-(1,2-epoxy-1,2-dihydrophenyl)acetyl-CoA isomerase
MTSKASFIAAERHGDVLVLTLDDPGRLNSISDEMRAGLLAAIEAAHLDPEIRSLVLTGAGGNFSAGGDIKQMENPGGGSDPDRFRRRLIPLHRVVELIAGGPKPVIAAVEGIAFGAGLSLAAACDHVVAGDTARFAASFGKVGLTADCGLVWTLPQRTGLIIARDMLLTARQVAADEALRIGIIDRLVPAGGALEAALAKAAEYRPVAPLAISAMKHAFAQGPGSLAETLSLERQQQPMLSMTEDHKEGIAAFKEKRAPVLRGK